MNPEQNLPLRDIHLPDAVSWWPLAPGWWVLMGLVGIALFALYWLTKKMRRPAIKKSARAELKHLMDDYATHQDAQELLQQLSILLRRIGLSYLPRQQAAGVTGKTWYQQLNALAQGNPLSADTIELLVTAPYRPHVELSAAQIEQLLKDVQQWIDALAAEVAHD